MDLKDYYHIQHRVHGECRACFETFIAWDARIPDQLTSGECARLKNQVKQAGVDAMKRYILCIVWHAQVMTKQLN